MRWRGMGGLGMEGGWGSSMPASQQDCNRGIAETKDQNTFACRTITQSQTWNMCLNAGYNIIIENICSWCSNSSYECFITILTKMCLSNSHL